MTRSVNELSALLAKAGRGAGLSLGACEDLAQAAGAFTVQDLAQLVDLLLSADGRDRLASLCLAVDLRETPPADLRGIYTALQSRQTAPPKEVPEPVWQALSDLATRTFVPATEASRRAGAGAAISDND